MDEVNHSSRPKRTKVLRAADVIPPFDNSVPAADDSRTEALLPPVSPAKVGDAQAGAENSVAPVGAGAAPEPPVANRVDIPSYDLAENILAEQRRAAGKRRRRPGRAEDALVVPIQGTSVRMSVPDLASSDLLELQRIVAEIVARDIERLCRRPDREAHIGL